VTLRGKETGLPFFFRQVSTPSLLCPFFFFSFFLFFQKKIYFFLFTKGWSVIKELFADERLKGKMAYQFQSRTGEDGSRRFGKFSAVLFMEHLQVGAHLPSPLSLIYVS